MAQGSLRDLFGSAYRVRASVHRHEVDELCHLKPSWIEPWHDEIMTGGRGVGIVNLTQAQALP